MNTFTLRIRQNEYFNRRGITEYHAGGWLAETDEELIRIFLAHQRQ